MTKAALICGVSLISLSWTPTAYGQSATKNCLPITRNVPIDTIDNLRRRVQSEDECVQEQSIRTFEPVEIYGDRQPYDAGSFSALASKDISDLAADHPAEVLNTLPGVNIHTNSGQEHLLAIRSPVLTGGAGQGSFLILENGIPTRSPAFGNVNMLLEPHHEVAEAIEVVRGPGSAKYGSNAVHGLVNVILAEPSGNAFTEVRASYGSLGRYKADAIYDQGYLGRASVSLQKDTGWRDNTDTLQAKGSGVAELVIAGWNVTAIGSASLLQQETADFLQGEDAYKDRNLAKTNDDPLAYRDAWSARGALSLSREIGEGELTLTPFLRTQQMDFRQHFLPNKSFEENGHSALGAMARYERSVSGNMTASVGADIDIARGDLKQFQNEPFGFFPGDSRFPVGVQYDYEVDTVMGAIWGELDWTLSDAVRLVAGLRGEAHNYDYRTNIPAGLNGRFRVPDNRSDDFGFVAPKLGLVWEASDDVALYANLSRGARAPQASDLYRIQSLQGAAEAEVETLDSLEIGARGAAFDGAIVFDVAAYWMEKENFFFRDANGLNVTDGTTRHQGVEAAFDWRFSDAFSVRGTAAWSDQIYAFDRDVRNGSEIIRDGNQIDTAPEWLADLAVIWAPIDAFEASISADYVGEYFTNPANTQSYLGHTVFNARAAYAVSETLDTYVIVRNLFDEAYADRADFVFGDERYFPGEPLNVTFGVRKRFE